ncbi:hypothetical protein Zmor_007372 [Zophobas morio]|uniref:Uncharacterized protein n=1 Tax=Zophobas morio TaxID=2755281 RepID=A0AA38M4S4_9CUCU|nr:hypothetical protein Zmor_025273 [Zophobas morio]KAJ3663063.1 hypothetical protein Zmor_007372 [Zophobas morio]
MPSQLRLKVPNIKKYWGKVRHTAAEKQDTKDAAFIVVCASGCLLLMLLFLKGHANVVTQTYFKQKTIVACTT